MIAACDAASGPHLILIGLLIIGPVCALLTARWTLTAAASCLAVALGIALGVPDQISPPSPSTCSWPPSRPSGRPPLPARRSCSTSAPDRRPDKLTVARREVWSASIRRLTGEVNGVHGVETILFLVVLGTVVAACAGRLRVPAPSLLVIAGLVVGLLPRFPPVHVPPDVVGLVVLPPLLYAASEELPWRELRAVWRPVTVLAVGLVLASAAAVAAVTWRWRPSR